MIKVALFDDHKERREALQLLLAAQDGMVCTGSYEHCASLVANLQHNVPDVVLMDIDMPHQNGIEGVKVLRRHFAGVHIIMQTVFEDDERIFASIRAGADGYILKKASPDKLIEGIYEVVAGGAPMTATVARRVLQLFHSQPADGSAATFDLSGRELEVLALLVKGFSQKMVAHQLSISPFTVANHIKKIYGKLHVHNASEAVAIALQKRIIT